MQKANSLFILAPLVLLSSSCASSHAKPCTLGGQPPRVIPAALIGKKSCDQVVDESGNYLNNGKYYEWFLNEKIATVGEYKRGKKTGRWIEYDESGKILSQLDFEDGKELPPAYELQKELKK